MEYKLICFDMDGVFFKDINFWMRLHEVFGTLEEGRKLTDKYLFTDYAKLVEEVVVKLWKGKDAKPYYDLVNSLEYLDGVKELMDHVKSKGYITAIVSSSSIDCARRVQKDYGIDHLFANELVIRDGKVSGEFLWPIASGKDEKADVVENFCKSLEVPLSEVIFIGDSDIDANAFKKVGRSIAFNSASDYLKGVATYVVESSDLKDLVKYIP